MPSKNILMLLLTKTGEVVGELLLDQLDLDARFFQKVFGDGERIPATEAAYVGRHDDVELSGAGVVEHAHPSGPLERRPLTPSRPYMQPLAFRRPAGHAARSVRSGR